jgi:hypothetical protein
MATYENALGRWDFVRDFGADPTYTSDNSALLTSALATMAALGGGTLYVPAGRYKFSGALQNTGTDNAQVLIPTVADNTNQVAILIKGALPAPTAFNFTGSYPVQTTGYSTFESTMTGKSGTACFLGAADHGSTFQANNLTLRFENMIFAAPANPTFTMLDLRFQYGDGDIFKSVLVRADSVDLTNMTQPTATNSYGVKMPGNNQSAWTNIHGLTVFGYYCGALWGENITGTGFRVWGCHTGIECVYTYHGSYMTDIGIYWCPYGIYGGAGDIGGPLSIQHWDIEHANGGGAAWQNCVADIYDPANYLHGKVYEYLSIEGNGGGNLHIFTKSGGTGFTCTELM